MASLSGLRKTNDDDLDISDGKLSLVRGATAVAQKLRARLQFFRGEWFLNRQEGIPYFTYILKKNPDPDIVRQILKYVILNTTGIVSLDSLEIVYDRQSRSMTYTFSATTVDGETVLGQDDFLVPV